MEQDFGAIQVGRIVLYRITGEDTDYIRSRLREQPDIDEVLAEFENEYLPTFDAQGRMTLLPEDRP